MIKLIATDMDGTFLTDNKDYDRPRFQKLLTKMRARGIRFVVASGNQYYQLRSFFNDDPDIVYLSENGAYIRSDAQVLAVNHFTQEAVQQLVPRLTAIPHVRVIVCGERSAYVQAKDGTDYEAFARQYYYQLQVLDSFADLPDDNILKFATNCPPAETQAVIRQLDATMGNLAEPTSSGHGDIDVIQPGMNKAAGLKRLGDHLNINLADMAAFGDGGNDLEMLREVGLGVAMANADPAVAAVADAHTTSNEEQGVLTFIENLLA
ncbi:Cof-type HAD-IIB family hydrolase [Schleiferilactobacillus perolens]|jgi:Cof subfamily protein (haloacid dehalogenase superfamily)|uniref:Cof-type HAD-IIB family hydrolase n=1 Tax=Schleiferilactobacillus perolens TaxID=100468 RepID=UPI002354BEC8|nr:Cof-type HAD-IIB family hydrolase [Schleiferilactobacillus perolens]MCI2170806.1 Cof-type HAD-IIB family hydrolase [Schleiferilactobacillus perolens]